MADVITEVHRYLDYGVPLDQATRDITRMHGGQLGVDPATARKPEIPKPAARVIDIEPDPPTPKDSEDEKGPPKDPLTGGIMRALDYKDAFEQFVADDDWKGDESRFYASGLGVCMLKGWFKDTNTAPDPGAAGFDEGVGERGNAVEDRITLMLRETHGPDAVLQNVRLTKKLTIEHPITREPKDIVLVCKTDPVIIGDNLAVLKLYEVKTKGWFSDELMAWPKKHGMWKVPLLAAGVDEKRTLGIPGAANIHNLLQLALEARVLRENGREPQQSSLLYVLPDNLAVHLEIVLSSTDITCLSDIAIEYAKQRMRNKLSKTPPSPLYAMAWECTDKKTPEGKSVAMCEWRDQCAALCKHRGEERRLNPLLGGVNEALKLARKNATTNGKA